MTDRTDYGAPTHTYGNRLMLCFRCRAHKPLLGGKIRKGPPPMFTCADCVALKLAKKEPA